LTFNGQNTSALAFNAPASTVQTALNALTSIGGGVGGLVSVSKASNVYTVTFQGTFTGFDQPQMSAGGAGGATAAVTTMTDGTGATLVSSGATLQLDLSGAASQTVTGEALQLNGSGVNGAGALDNISGANTWAGAFIDL